MKNRLQGILIGLILGITLCSVAFAEQIVQTISVVFDNYRIYIDGKDASNYPDDQKPLNYNGRIYVPLRYISEQMGKEVSWESESNSIYISKAYTTNFKAVPYGIVTKEDLMKAGAIVKDRLVSSGITEIRYSVETDGITFSSPEGVLKKSTLLDAVSQGSLTLQDKNGNVILNRDDLLAAYVCNDDLLGAGKQVYIEIQLTETGKQKFAEGTLLVSGYGNNENYIKVMLDEKLISMPYVYGKIDAQKIVINGSFTEESAKSLAAVLNSEVLPCTFIEVK